MTSNKVRAILIDPEKRALTEIHIGNGIEEIYAALHCEHFTTGAYLNGSIKAKAGVQAARAELLRQIEAKHA